jgi:ABC-type glycerol-3-phosphate transport system substrate-binding protein
MFEQMLPRPMRKFNYTWGVAAFPSDVPGMKDVAYADYDVLVIPRGAIHKAEAFEFMTYVNRQDVMEKLNALHCKNSPLRNVSREFIERHPNPYIDVFEHLANSPNAHGQPQVPIISEAYEEVQAMAQGLALLQTDAKSALAASQARVQGRWIDYLEKQQQRKGRN